jgi:hypothetical protein
MLNEHQVLQAVERICGDADCEELEWSFCTGNLTIEDAKTAVSKLGDIYRLVHSHDQTHSCYSVHEAWRKEAEEVYRSEEKSGK